MGSTPSTPAALIRAWSLSACCIQSQPCILAKEPPRTGISSAFFGVAGADDSNHASFCFFFCSLVSYSLASIESQTAPAISHMWSFCLVARRRVEWETYGDLNAIVGEDQGRVGGGELSSRHCV